MLNDNQFLAWTRQLSFPDRTIKVIEHIRNSPPSRKVKGGKGNVSGRFCSTKMGVTIQFEGWAEYATLYEAEYDQECFEIYDQPPQIAFEVLNKAGRKQTVPHTADYFLIRRSDAGWVQCKREEEFERIFKEKPNLYIRDESGHWRCPPGEIYAQQFGLKFWVKSTKDFSWDFISNLRYLEDYLQNDCHCPQGDQDVILSIVRKNQGLSISKLRSLLPDVKVDNILWLISNNKLFVNLKECRLSEPDYTKVFTTFEVYNAYSAMRKGRGSNTYNVVEIVAGNIFLWNQIPYRILNPGPEELIIKPCLEGKPFSITRLEFTEYVAQGLIVGVHDEETTPSEVQKILAYAGPKQLERANYKYKIVQSIIENTSNLDDIKIPDRTVRHWVHLYGKAEKELGYGYLGLLDKYYKCGNREPRLLPEVVEVIRETILQSYETLKQPGIRAIYGQLLLNLEQLGLPELSYKTFTTYVKARKGPEQTEKRQGFRAAYQEEYKYWHLERETERHGSYPLSIVHIDHTELDITLKHSQTGKDLGKPWLSLAICTYTRRIVAYWLTFDPPSKRTCMGIIREIVRRHQLLPKWFVVDNAKEFGSVYFETLTALYKCNVMKRPPARPRFGSVCERVFGTVNTQFVHNLAGNTQIMKEVRKVTKLNNPKNLATWTLLDLYVAISTYIDEIYDTIEHPALGQSPREAFIQGQLVHGYREHRKIPYDQTFIDQTMPTTGKGEARANSSEGVKINNIYYWSNLFKDPQIIGKPLPVRYDPFDVSIAKVFIGTWVTCTSSFTEFKGRSEKEILLINEQLRVQNRNHSKTFNITSKKMAAYILDVERTNTEIALQRDKDLEQRSVLTLIYGGKADKTDNFTEISSAYQAEKKYLSQSYVPSKLAVYEDW